MKRLILITGILVALLGLIRTSEATSLGYASNNSGEIHLIDLGSATSVSSFNTGINFFGLAIDPTETTLYGSTINGDLYSIDINTQATTRIGNMGLGNHANRTHPAVEAMDFNGTELWVTDFGYPVPKIYSIDTSTAVATHVQTFDPNSTGFIRSMAVDSSTKVLGMADTGFTRDLLSIDTSISTDNVTVLGSTPMLGPDIRGMDLYGGTLYGLSAVGEIYTIDKGNGDMTNIGSVGSIYPNSWNSLATRGAPGSVPTPEPATVFLLGIGIAGLACVEVRRRYNRT